MAQKVSAAAFVAFLKERVAAGDGYIFGATGQNPKELSDWYFSGQYSGGQLKKALYWKQNAARVWDCNGLAEGYYRDMTGTNINTRARNNYSQWCEIRGSGLIPAAQRVPGAAVFKKSSYIHHVGFLERPVNADNPGGDWYVIEARGVMYGVVRTRLLNHGWNMWGLMTRYFSYDASAMAEEENAVLGSRLLRRGNRGEDVRQLQKLMLEMGYDLPRYGADGDFGTETEAALKRMQAALDLEVDGVYGEATHAALMAALEKQEDGDETDDAAPAKRIRVTASRSAYVRSGPGKDYSVITAVRSGMEFESTAAADNGWRCIRINENTGWISPKMCTEV